MKFVHIADMHFDSAFTSLTANGDLGEFRRLEQRKIFKTIIDYIKENNVEYFFISGDLYENQYIRQTTIEYINNLFKEIPNTKIFISPGNHDPFLKNSYYNTYNWSENVKIFGRKIEKCAYKDINIYGQGFDDFYMERTDIENIVLEEKNKINIFVTHGSLDASDSLEKKYNPISSNNLKKIGFDYIALGHIHKLLYEENAQIVYPSSTISLGFDEPKEHGMITRRNNKRKSKIRIY